MALEQVTWRLQVSVGKSEMKLSVSCEIRFLILILRALTACQMSQRVLVCSLLEGCVVAVRGEVEGPSEAPFSRRTADLRVAVLAFSFHPK